MRYYIAIPKDKDIRRYFFVLEKQQGCKVLWSKPDCMCITEVSEVLIKSICTWLHEAKGVSLWDARRENRTEEAFIIAYTSVGFGLQLQC